MKRIPNRVKALLIVFFCSVIICSAAFAAGDKEQAANDVMKVVYAPDSNGPDHFWPDDSLERVFMKYWRARVAGDWEAARKMEAPYFQEMTRPDRYKVYTARQKKWDFLEMQLLHFNWEEEQLGKIDFVLLLRLRNGQTQKVHMSDWWVKAEGAWYHVIRDRFFFPGV